MNLARFLSRRSLAFLVGTSLCGFLFSQDFQLEETGKWVNEVYGQGPDGSPLSDTSGFYEFGDEFEPEVKYALDKVEGWWLDQDQKKWAILRFHWSANTYTWGELVEFGITSMKDGYPVANPQGFWPDNMEYVFGGGTLRSDVPHIDTIYSLGKDRWIIVISQFSSHFASSSEGTDFSFIPLDLKTGFGTIVEASERGFLELDLEDLCNEEDQSLVEEWAREVWEEDSWFDSYYKGEDTAKERTLSWKMSIDRSGDPVLVLTEFHYSLTRENLTENVIETRYLLKENEFVLE